MKVEETVAPNPAVECEGLEAPHACRQGNIGSELAADDREIGRPAQRKAGDRYRSPGYVGAEGIPVNPGGVRVAGVQLKRERSGNIESGNLRDVRRIAGPL